jgi:O-antigen/teichoic acid export membrane protein
VRLLGVLRTSAGIAIALAVTNVGTYGFQMLAARLLGPIEYGAVAALMALLMVLSVVQLGIQATAARRIASDPGDVLAIQDTVMAIAWRTAVGLTLVAMAASPLIMWLLRIDSPWPVLLLALTVLPITVMGGQAGVLQGERRWMPLSLLYLAIGLPRALLGGGFLLFSPTATSGMLGVLVAAWLPVLIGSAALSGRRRSDRAAHSRAVRSEVVRELITSSLALLAFMALANLDVVVARAVLDHHDAGLYAAGLIVTKAVLFLPYFAVVILFPAMSTAAENRRAVQQGLLLLSGLGLVCVVGAHLLSGVALIFIGGNAYVAVQQQLWLFALLGGLLGLLQLMVYAGLAARGRWTKYVIVAGAIAVVVLGSGRTGVTELVVTVALIDAVVLAVLLGLQVVRNRTGRATVEVT